MVKGYRRKHSRWWFLAVLLCLAAVALFTISGQLPVWLGIAARANLRSGPGGINLNLPGTVIRVIDGDTADIQLDSGVIRVRFHGIDAPERKAPFGRQATAALRKLLPAGAEVELVPVEQDRYDRLVAVVLVHGASANEAMIAEGFAWAFRHYLGQVPGDERYCELEAAARDARLGLWSQPAGRWVPPWIYRAREKAPPGAAIPSPDFSHATAADCVADIRQARSQRQGAAALPAPAPHQPGCDIKGNISGKGAHIYHVPGTPNYERTTIDTAKGERWFCTEAEARAAGWRAPN